MKTMFDLLWEWDLINTPEKESFAKKVLKMLFFQKQQEFGKDMIEDSMFIINNMNKDIIKEYIDNIDDWKRKIVCADTFFYIIRGTSMFSF